MKTEILAPAGGAGSARCALLAGADAIYLGLSEFSARASAENFSVQELAETARFAHLLGAKVYVCLNTLVKDSETAGFFALAERAWNAGADGILLQDIFLGKALKEAHPEMVLHLSTQAGCNNIYGANLAKQYGFSRVVLARETPLEEIKKISEIIETEVFVQGALCSCFSGQCYFSSFAGNNSGNRGRCKQPCRKQYSIDRKGYEGFAYALSTSDLCTGERVKELVAAGVTSLKIEGRMRREEYTAAAVQYYRALLWGENAEGALSRLKRAYNRGDYTAGLAFGQKADFLSRRVQGHIGERVGTLSIDKGKYFCRSSFAAKSGDGFKILRKGEEVGGAVFAGSGAGGFYLSSNAKLFAGDEVRVTTDTAAYAYPEKKRRVEIKIEIRAGELPLAVSGELRYTGEVPAQAAKSAPLTEEEIRACFEKTDSLPLLPVVTVKTENAFYPKSALNAFRREFYARLVNYLAPVRTPLQEAEFSACVSVEEGALRAVMVGDNAKPQDADIVIYKPKDYGKITVPAFGKEKFLYLPPLFTGADEDLIAGALHAFDGIYAEGSYGIELAKKYNKTLFAGAGCNLTNAFAVNGITAAGAKYFVLSHELSSREQDELSAMGAFALSGGVKVMELCYCPFERTCKECDKREFYTLTDSDGRKFPLRRVRHSEGCRFEVYNCAPLAAEKGKANGILDCTAEKALAGVPPTRGHAMRSML
ncbi:MAG: U32 family peptidase [Clostridia bacterium]|nr:U32 family peptidase [Clostridia bacterium]